MASPHPLLFCYCIAFLICAVPDACNHSFPNRFHSVPMEFVHFPCPQALSHWLHCAEGNDSQATLQSRFHSAVAEEEEEEEAEPKGCPGRLLALEQWTGSLLLQPPHSPSLTLGLPQLWQPLDKINQTRWRHSVCYRKCRNQTTQLWGFCPIHTWNYDWFYVELLFGFNTC